jgi:hypothetical protein
MPSRRTFECAVTAVATSHSRRRQRGADAGGQAERVTPNCTWQGVFLSGDSGHLLGWQDNPVRASGRSRFTQPTFLAGKHGGSRSRRPLHSAGKSAREFHKARSGTLSRGKGQRRRNRRQLPPRTRTNARTRFEESRNPPCPHDRRGHDKDLPAVAQRRGKRYVA